MKILVVNDDGITTKGIRLLVDVARQFGKVTVVAPSSQQSAISHGLTIYEPFEITKLDNIFDDINSYRVGGKPADCVKVATQFLNLNFDLVVSGVNDGPNLGSDVAYSGTIAGASEGHLFNIPAIAFSTDFDSFEIIENELYDCFKFIIDNNIHSKDYVLNVNFPFKNHEKSKGYKFTTQGRRDFKTEYVIDDGLYWQKGTWIKTKNKDSSDVEAAKNGYISITPLRVERTDYSILEELKNKYND